MTFRPFQVIPKGKVTSFGPIASTFLSWWVWGFGKNLRWEQYRVQRLSRLSDIRHQTFVDRHYPTMNPHTPNLLIMHYINPPPLPSRVYDPHQTSSLEEAPPPPNGEPSP